MERKEMAQFILDKLTNRDECVVMINKDKSCKVSKMSSEFAMKAFDLMNEDSRRLKAGLTPLPLKSKILGVYTKDVRWDWLMEDLEYAGI